MKAAYKYIESIQDDFYQKEDGLPLWFNIRDSLQNPAYKDLFLKESGMSLDDLNSLFNALNRPLPTKFENPYEYPIINDLYTNLTDSIKLVNKNNGKPNLFNVEQFPVIGTLPIKTINAFICKVPNSDEFAILLNHGIIKFSLILSRLFDLLITENKHGWIDFNAISKNIILRNYHLKKKSFLLTLDEFRKYFVTYEYGDEFMNGEYVLHKTSQAKQYADSYIKFILAHELGHFFKQHLAEFELKIPSTLEDYKEQISKHYRMESEADVVGAILLVENLNINRLPIHFAIIGITIFYCSIDILYGSVFSTTHPRTRMRYETVEKTLRNHYPRHKMSIEIGFEIGNTLYDIIKENYE
ncbi:M48 family metalloprotease [Sunxiuqinia elliptica]|nr:hypothetical protein [Sunxiuqinia elliptica]